MGEWMCRSTFFLTSALAGGEWSASRSWRFTPRERAPGTRWIVGVVEARAGLSDVEERKFLTLQVLELRPLGRPAHSQSLYQLRQPGSTLGPSVTLKLEGHLWKHTVSNVEFGYQHCIYSRSKYVETADVVARPQDLSDANWTVISHTVTDVANYVRASLTFTNSAEVRGGRRRPRNDIAYGKNPILPCIPPLPFPSFVFHHSFLWRTGGSGGTVSVRET
jgi:hypothetical protein